jgi:hypothetical protein
MNPRSEFSMVWLCAVPTHEHLSWEEANVCSQLEQQLTHLQRELTQLMIACLLALATLLQEPSVKSERLQEAYDLIYVQLRARYEAAGEPYGPSEEAMWRWLLLKAEG